MMFLLSICLILIVLWRMKQISATFFVKIVLFTIRHLRGRNRFELPDIFQRISTKAPTLSEMSTKK